MLDGSFYRRAFWNGKTDMKSFMLLFLLLIQQFCFTNHNFILFKFHLVEVFYFYFCWIILHYNKAGTVSWAGRNSRSRRGCNPQHMMGEQLDVSIFIHTPSPSLQGCSLIRTAPSEDQSQLLRSNSTPPLWPDLYRPACKEQPSSWIPTHLLWWNNRYISSRCLGTTCTTNVHDPHPFLYLMSNRDAGNINSPSSLALVEQ